MKIDLSDIIWRRGAQFLSGSSPDPGEPDFDPDPRGLDRRSAKAILIANRIRRHKGRPEIDYMSVRGR